MRILCVDDEPERRMVLSMALSMDPEFDPQLAESVEACLAIAREGTIDAILLHATLPGLDGLAACRRLKADPATAQIPVVLLADASPGTLVPEALAAGAIACLTKPVDPLTLARALREALDA